MMRSTKKLAIPQTGSSKQVHVLSATFETMATCVWMFHQKSIHPKDTLPGMSRQPQAREKDAPPVACGDAM